MDTHPDAPWTADTAPAADETDWRSASAAAVELGVSQRTIRRAIARGELPAVKISGVFRIAVADLASYRAERGSAAPTPLSPRDPLRLLPATDRATPPGEPPRPRTRATSVDCCCSTISSMCWKRRRWWPIS